MILCGLIGADVLRGHPPRDSAIHCTRSLA
jgi:hypothetical protein